MTQLEQAYQTGNRLFLEQGDREAAILEYHKAAEGGHTGAMYSLGLLLEEKGESWLMRSAELGFPDAQSEIANRLVQQGDIAGALPWYRRAAEGGHDWAQYYLACLLAAGEGYVPDVQGPRYQSTELDPKNAAEALYWFKKAADQGHLDAQLNLGLITKDPNWLEQAAKRGHPLAQHQLALMLFEQDRPSATHWFLQAAEQGNTESQHLLANLMADEANWEQAVRWFGQAAQADHLESQAQLGYILAQQGQDEQSAHWLQKAAQQGHPEACRNLAVLYATGRGLEQSPEAAARWYLVAAEKGHQGAQMALSGMYATGEGVEKNPQEAVRWTLQAAHQGYPPAQLRLGRMLAEGFGVEKAPAEALQWIGQAAQQGYDEAQFELSEMLPHPDEAHHWLVKAAENGHPLAQNVLGLALIDQDMAQAVRCFEASAQQGCSEGQYNLGVLYYQGQGLPQDLRQAAHWFRLAAEDGHPKAQYNLATIVQDANPQLALQLYRESAEQGLMYSQFGLGEMLADGQGCPPDPKQAEFWLQQALEQGHPYAADLLNRLRA